MRIKEYLKENPLITDGAMGTYFEEKYPKEKEIAEAYNKKDADKILQIHKEYIKSGAKLIRTNTFAANSMFFSSRKEVLEIVEKGYKIAEQAVRESKEEVFIGADIGPIFDSGFLEEDIIAEEYRFICDVFLSCGAEIFVFETQTEFHYIEEITRYLKSQKDVFIIVQFTLDKSGYTKSGIRMEQLMKKACAMENIDAYGFNCGVGAAHLYQLLKEVKFPSDKILSVLPNAGYPVTLRGRSTYANSQSYFVDMMEKMAALGADILGGCCGTTPEYIQKMSQGVAKLKRGIKSVGNGHVEEASKASTSLAEKLKSGEKVYIVELDPPFGVDTKKVEEGAKILKEIGIDTLTLADSPMARARMDAGKLAARIQETVGLNVMPHISCRDKNVIGMRSSLLGDYRNELRNFLIVTGDPVSRDAKGQITSVFDFNSIRFMDYVKRMNEDVFVEEPVFYGGALNYHGANPDAIIQRMQKKIDAGCGCFLTQPIYSKGDMERIAYIKERSEGKIICGILPLVSYKNAMFVANEMPGIHVPKEIIARYRPDMSREEAEEVAVESAVMIAEKLKEIADGYYFMTPFNRAGMIGKIIKALKGEEA